MPISQSTLDAQKQWMTRQLWHHHALYWIYVSINACGILLGIAFGGMDSGHCFALLLVVPAGSTTGGLLRLSIARDVLARLEHGALAIGVQDITSESIARVQQTIRSAQIRALCAVPCVSVFIILYHAAFPLMAVYLDCNIRMTFSTAVVIGSSACMGLLNIPLVLSESCLLVKSAQVGFKDMIPASLKFTPQKPRVEKFESLKEMYGSDFDPMCVICLVEMQDSEDIAQLPCGHCYHEMCLRGWFMQQQSCPFKCNIGGLLLSFSPEAEIVGSISVSTEHNTLQNMESSIRSFESSSEEIVADTLDSPPPSSPQPHQHPLE